MQVTGHGWYDTFLVTQTFRFDDVATRRIKLMAISQLAEYVTHMQYNRNTMLIYRITQVFSVIFMIAITRCQQMP